MSTRLKLYIDDSYYEEYPESYIFECDEETKNSLFIENEKHSYEINRLVPTFLGKDGDVIFNTNLIIKYYDGTMIIEGNLNKERLYINQERVFINEVKINEGDILFIDNTPVQIILFKNKIQITGDAKEYHSKLIESVRDSIKFEGYPLFKRSPRIIKRVPDKKIEIKAPPQNRNVSTSSLLQTIIPPIAMALVTVGVGIVMGRGMYLLISVAGATVTTVFAIIKYTNDKKSTKEANIKRNVLYEKYLLNKRQELYLCREKEKESYDFNYPSIKKQEDLINNYSFRLYERVHTDDDFLSMTIGKQYGQVSYPIEVKEAELSIDNDELEEKGRELKQKFSTIMKERIINLQLSNLGLIGNKEIIHEQLNLYIMQLATFHSYHDLQMIIIYEDSNDKEFEWMRWLPHLKIQALNMRGMIHSEKTRDQVLNSMNQILKDRKQVLEENKKEAKFTPHFVFIIDEPKLIMDHYIMEFLNKKEKELDFSIIYTSYLRENLPENIETILLLEDSNTGKLILDNKVLKNEMIKLPRLQDTNLEKMARNLSTVVHLQGTASQIPESITFFDLYKVSHPEELNVLSRWRSHFAHKSLAVPLGIRAEDDIVELNLHEKAHGPHGLIAGTTGSGKSEIIQSYILSLVVNFHPYEVGFLLIDYKGGGMASLFKDLPHLLGTITNLDGSESMRAMASIKSELERRQRIFNENDVNNINAYSELFKEGAVNEPLPHLFLISDEFAELKKEQPEFMKELVSAARIGRSLGVHLILATQKPSGVVDDQIWSNSKFKLALKVQNEADSKEILKSPDAASIIQPGRAYLQVGNNEIYELFQSAWSGATYVKDKEQDVSLDNRVYLVNDLGQGILINDDLSGNKEEKKSKETQLDAVINHIADLYENETTVEIKKPWLPPLGSHIKSVIAIDDEFDPSYEISIPLGLIDVPEFQVQNDYVWNATNDGNLAMIASGGYGKSVFLTTIGLSLAIKYSVSEVHLFVLDFGNNSLISLKQLPHTAEYISLDDDERYFKFKGLIIEEIKERKKKLSKIMAQNISTYNQLSDEQLPNLIILVDNFDAIREKGFEEEEYFTKITRDGPSLGVYFVITASRTNAIRMATFNNFKQKIAGFNFEPSEITTIVGRSPYKIPEIKGRTLVKNDELINTMQIYSMSTVTDEVSYIKEIQQLVQQVRDKYPNEEAPHIPILPEEFNFSDMSNYPNDASNLYLGLDKNSVVLTGIESTNSPFLIYGESQKGKTHNVKVLLEQIVEKQRKCILFDSNKMELYNYRTKESIEYISDFESFEKVMEKIQEEVISREEQLRQKMQDINNNMSPSDIVTQMESMYIVIEEFDDFYGLQVSDKKSLLDILQRSINVNIMLVVSATVGKLQAPDELTRWIKQSKNGLLLSSQGYQNIFPIPYGKDNIEMGEGLLFINSSAKQLMLVNSFN